MNVEIFTAFFIFISTAVFTPGPNNLMLMTSGSLFGSRATLPHILGVQFGFATLFVAVIFGIDFVLQQMPWLMITLRALGALWLIWFGWQFIKSGLLKTNRQNENEPQNRLRPLRFYEAFFFQWINPKGLLMATSSAGAFILLSPNVAARAVIMGTTCALLGTIASCTWTVAGSQLAHFFGNSDKVRWLEVIMGGLLILMAVMLFMI